MLVNSLPAIGIQGIAFTDDQRAACPRPCRICGVMRPFGGQVPSMGMGLWKDQLLLAVQHAGQVDVGLEADLARISKIEAIEKLGMTFKSFS
jgi:hypothetical protein